MAVTVVADAPKDAKAKSGTSIQGRPLLQRVELSRAQSLGSACLVGGSEENFSAPATSRALARAKPEQRVTGASGSLEVLFVRGAATGHEPVRSLPRAVCGPSFHFATTSPIA